MQPDEALALLKQGSAQIINESELREKLALGRTNLEELIRALPHSALRQLQLGTR